MCACAAETPRLKPHASKRQPNQTTQPNHHQQSLHNQSIINHQSSIINHRHHHQSPIDHQFYVADGELSCQLYQRSADVGLGVPFNIASYALLTRMLAQVCDLTPGDFVHTLGDAHVYANHVEPLRRQLENAPRAFPRLRIVGSSIDDIDSFAPEHFELDGYRPHPTIKMQMAV